MNSAKAPNHHSSPNFKTVLDTAISYRHLDSLIWECNDKMLHERSNIEKVKIAIQCKIKLNTLINGMRAIEEISDEGFTEEDIVQFNTEYIAIYDLMLYLREKPELIQEVRREVAQITMQPRVGNIYTFPTIARKTDTLAKLIYKPWRFRRVGMRIY